MSDLRKRKVTRVLVMLEYGPDDPDSGEVFDLTALAEDLYPNTREHGGPEIELQVNREKDWSETEPSCYVAWKAGSRWGDFRSPAGRLVDAVNSGLPDSETVVRINKSIERARARIQKLQFLAAEERLKRAAEVRSKHPIARVTANPLADVAPALESEVRA